VTSQGRGKPGNRRVTISCITAFLIIVGLFILKASYSPHGVQGEGRGGLDSLSLKSPLEEQRPDEESPSRLGEASPIFQGSDPLDRLRALRSPALEQEILDIAGRSVTRVVLGEKPGPSENDADKSSSSPLKSIQAGVFVTIIIDNKVRGCMGRIYPGEPNLYEEIKRAARMAATMDIRHPPITAEDLDNLEFCVSVVGRVRRESPDVIVNPRLEGILIKTSGRSGVILPGEARTSKYQKEWAMREAGIGAQTPFELYVFETEKFGKTLPVRG
jgi:AMMECR1 domain-containing protein